MITKVQIENFQSHKKSELEFAPGTNVIIGKSDAGKSAVFRAINWVISNRPLGDSFRAEWGGDTKVILHTSDGHIIERIRSATRNEYTINGQSLKAFGSEVPEEVTKILQLDSFNIQAQMDPPFLLAISPGEAAKLLNKAASIDDIDWTMAGIKKAHTELVRKIKHLESQLIQSTEQIKQYDQIDLIESKVILIEKEEEKITEQRTRLNKLTSLTADAKELTLLLQSTEQVPVLLKRIEETKDKMTECAEKNLRTTKLKQLTERAQRLQDNLKRAEDEIKKTEEEYRKLAPSACPLCGGKMPQDFNSEPKNL